MSLPELLMSNPVEFIKEIAKETDYLSEAQVARLDALDPLKHTADLFDIDEKLQPFAGHSLGPLLKPAGAKITATLNLQKTLHGGHYPDSHPEGKQSGHWFDCDLYQPGIAAAKKILGFKEDREFCFTNKGLSENLAMVMDNFFRITRKDWQAGKTQISMLETEFFSDQAVAASVAQRAIRTAEDHETIKPDTVKPAELISSILADEDGLYKTEDIIAFIKKNAQQLQMICLPHIVFSTGQRLELEKIFAAVKTEIENNKIIVILDLAHSVGNRPISLQSMPITAAVGCAYKHMSGPAGSAFGLYVNGNADLKKYPPLQGWKAADPARVFPLLNGYDPRIMEQKGGAKAFRISNPPPIPLLPAQVFLTEFDKIGFDKCFNKSEALTLYLIAQLQKNLGDKIKIITPLDPNQRGATIVFKLLDKIDVEVIEKELRKAGFEIDTRPPNVIRMTAHYGYTSFTDIYKVVEALKLVLEQQLKAQKDLAQTIATSVAADNKHAPAVSIVPGLVKNSLIITAVAAPKIPTVVGNPTAPTAVAAPPKLTGYVLY